MDVLQDLKARDLIFQSTDDEALSDKLKNESLTVYVGFDPTADSLHIGSLVPIICLRKLQDAGHKPIAVVGGATGMIGDPSGKSAERTLNTENVVQEWTEKLKRQLSRFLDFNEGDNKARIVNNYDWTKNLDVINFLRDVGKNFSINYMLSKESVSARLENGISFTEFAYMILQAYDFLKLNENFGCTLQVGGSDQWGNITAGIELIRRVKSEQAYGMTFPLITKSDGTKFGKSESGTIWLDAEKTSPYEFYQFWINCDDRDVIRFLKYFTFLSFEKIAELEESLKNEPEKREAQRVLAEEVTTFVHGQEATQRAINITESLFTGNIQELTEIELKEAFKGVPTTHFEATDEKGLIDLLVEANVVSSKRQAREDIKNGAVYINGSRRQDMSTVITREDLLYESYAVIRRGKKKYFLAIFGD